MSTLTALTIVMWLSLTAYSVLAGADFGAGIWDLLAGTTESGRPRRALIEHVIGPVWEANHVWLIFVLVLLWSCFPPVFAAIASTLYIPLTLVALGIIGRGAAFAFRKAVITRAQQRIFGATFALSSLLTPFFLGAAAGAIATDRVPPGIARGNVITSWWNPTSIVVGLLALSACAFLAAVYLSEDARRTGDAALTGYFRHRALISGALTGALSLAGLLTAHHDAPVLFRGLSRQGLPLAVTAIVAGITTLTLVAARQFRSARATAALAVAALLWAWGVARYPQLLPGMTAQQAAALPATLRAMTIVVIVGVVLLVPSMAYLFVLFAKAQPQPNVGD